MLTLLRFWWSFDAPVPRHVYRVHGMLLILLKYAGDAALVALATGAVWTPLDYFASVPSILSTFAEAPAWLMPALAIWSLPFIWMGVTLTARRAYDAGWSPWWAVIFFIPLVNYIFMLVLCALPTAPPQPEPPRVPSTDSHRAANLLLSVGAGGAIAGAMVAIEVGVFKQYGFALFVGTPFTAGAVTGAVYNRRAAASQTETTQAVLLMLAASTVLAFGLAVEGAVCILMASPLIAIVALLGGRMGREIALRCRHVPPAFFALLMLPAASALEPPGSTGRVLHEVRSSIEIAAAPGDVWPHVISFSPITARPELPFLLGVAEPLSARIEGSGIGAVRYCTFSTGAFVEPITAWEPGRRLAFDVTSSPAALKELSPYGNVTPPHLRGYLRSQRGEFRLVALPGGRTRLEGSTWYELQMAPEGYWQVFSDYLIHQIHRRVLAHIKDEAEGR